MKILISNTLNELLKIFAHSMAEEGKPAKSVMEKHLQELCDKAVAYREREIIMQIKGTK